MSTKFTLTGAYSADIERKLNEAADLIAATLDQPTDSRAWDHLLIYAPREALERRLQTLGCEGDSHVSSLRPIRPNDEVRERRTQNRGLEPRTENTVAHEPRQHGETGAHVLSGGVEAVAGIKPGPSDRSQAKATEGKAGMAVGTPHVRQTTAGTGLRVGEAGAVQPATSEFMDVTAGETAPFPSDPPSQEASAAEPKSEGERLHEQYDGNGRDRENGGFCS